MKLRRTAPPQGNAILKPQWPPSTAERFNPQGRATAAPCSANCYPLLVSSCLLLAETKLNALENWYCSTSFWRWMTRERLLPWLLGGADVGDHVLEIGAGQAPPPRNCENAPVMSSVLSTTISSPQNSHEGTTMPASCKAMQHPCPLPIELSPRLLRYLSCIICGQRTTGSCLRRSSSGIATGRPLFCF